jgi:hypothetical protein
MLNYRHRMKCAKAVKHCGNCSNCVLMPVNDIHYGMCILSGENNTQYVYSNFNSSVVSQYGVCDLWQEMGCKIE